MPTKKTSKMKDTRDKGSILNGIVEDAARVMEMKLETDLWTADLQEKNGHNLEVAAVLRQKAKRVQAAIDLMREYGGCWS